MSRLFEGKVALVTGAAGGIGRATALRFAAEGARVALLDLPGTALSEATGAVREAGGFGLALEADVTRRSDWERAVEKTCAELGGVDFLFNNAGVEGVVTPLEEYPEEVFDRVIAVNLKGVWLGMRAVVPALRARGGGVIVNTASTAGLGATPNVIPYIGSKHAVVGMTKVAALELAKEGIRVCAVCPAPIETRMMRSLEHGMDPADPSAAKTRVTAQLPLGRYGQPEEVAAVVMFLCSPEASFMTGGSYLVDGGWMAGR